MRTLLLALLFSTSAFAQSQDFTALGSTDSTTILTILKGIEETDNVSIAVMNVSNNIKGKQRVFVWWRVDGVKKDYTRGMFVIDRTQDNVIGYSISANRKHPKSSLLDDSHYIEGILAKSF